MSMPDNANGGVGATVQVPISAAPGDGILGIDMTLQYNAAVVVAQDVTVSGIAATAGFGLVRNLNNPGSIIISTYATQDALVGSGEIARIQFLVVGTPGRHVEPDFHRVYRSTKAASRPISIHGLFTVTCAGAPNGTACNDGNGCTANETRARPVRARAARAPGSRRRSATWQFAADHSTITGTRRSGAGPGTVHDVARGLVSQLPVGAGPARPAWRPVSPRPRHRIRRHRRLMSSYWYLVRGRNTCGTGTYGFRGINGAPGAERTSTTCP